MKTEFEYIEKELKKLGYEHYGMFVKGSRLYNTHKSDSDYDFLVIVKGDIRSNKHLTFKHRGKVFDLTLVYPPMLVKYFNNNDVEALEILRAINLDLVYKIEPKLKDLIDASYQFFSEETLISRMKHLLKTEYKIYSEEEMNIAKDMLEYLEEFLNSPLPKDECDKYNLICFLSRPHCVKQFNQYIRVLPNSEVEFFGNKRLPTHSLAKRLKPILNSIINNRESDNKTKIIAKFKMIIELLENDKYFV
jgi:predicted nucleotidyltransferase